eukprot:TRINITY_DN4486_c0_g1_i2.p1 TRINITY_DN4486_c0_g1~~TRINITY_DN4486_c0_g1_i2.p1  ORF type:complete len:198 (+),score=22.53 TRINITY_DN4486_c0_g1_i2:103-696(+)
MSRQGLKTLRSQLGSQNVGYLWMQSRMIGKWVPEYFAKPSPYTEGTDFLGTPKNHQDLVKKRPLSPDVLEMGDKVKLHYVMSLASSTSIANRITGCILSAGFAGMGLVALMGGNVPGMFAAIKAGGPLISLPVKTAIVFPLVYHLLGGVRHLVWDTSKIGMQSEKDSYFELEKVELSSKILIGVSAALSVIVALYNF